MKKDTLHEIIEVLEKSVKEFYGCRDARDVAYEIKEIVEYE
jgi:hypothetical protein